MTRSPAPGRHVAVTGGTSGLGLALVANSRRGAAASPSSRAPRPRRAVGGRSHGTHGIVGDVSRKEDVHPIAMQITGALGGLDVLINNASSLGPGATARRWPTPTARTSRLALATNLVGPFRLTKALLGALAASAREARAPLVLNISAMPP